MAAKLRIAANPEVREDGWANPTIGFGTPRDKTEAGYYLQDPILLPQEAAALYYGNDIGATIVEAVVDGAYRKGFQLKAEDTEKAEELQKWAEKTLDLSCKVRQAHIWGRLFGGCLLIVGAEDGQAYDQELRPEKIRTVSWLLLVDARTAHIEKRHSELGPKLGEPEIYQVTTSESSKTLRVHASRCIRFGGVTTDPIFSRSYVRGWDLSVLQRAYQPMRQFANAMQSAGIMMTDASQGVLKIKGLLGMIAAKEQSALHTRMQLLDMQRSTSRSIAIDADTEDFKKEQTTFAGVPEILDRHMQRLSSASKIPVSIFMGRSAAGMNATGDLDVDSWISEQESFREKDAEPRLLALYDLISRDRNAPTKGKPIEDLGVHWPKLRVVSEKEDSEAYKIRAEGDNIYAQMGAVDPAEIGIARFGRGEYSTEAPQVDVERLESELETRAEFEPMPAQVPGQADPADPADPNAPPATPTEPDAEAESQDDPGAAKG